MTTATTAPVATAAPVPFLKWPGGKRTLVPTLRAFLPTTPVHRYVEPFVGGGAGALALMPRLRPASVLLADACVPLGTAWQAALNPAYPWTELDDLITEYNGLPDDKARESMYLRVRSDLNGFLTFDPTLVRPDHFIFLNRAGFNGLWRVAAKRGICNVPFGKRKKLSRGNLTSENLAAIRAALGANTVVLPQDFQTTLAGCGVGDFVYCDPPYMGCWDDYTAGGFPYARHVDLAVACREAAKRGAHVVLSNSAQAAGLLAVNGAEVHGADEKRAINRDGAGRGETGTVIGVWAPGGGA